jgi:hypothetical protein
MKDPFTNEEFEPKRLNQRFANSQNRIGFYNNKANKLRREKAFVDKPLNTNLKILNDIMKGKDDENFHEEFLRGKGYNFEVYNGISKSKNNTGYSVYNYILIFKTSHVNIIRNT